jgi:hypothetical protein
MAWAEYALGEIESIAGTGQHVVHLQRAVGLGRRAGAPITLGVALVTLTAADARAGRVIEACNGYLDLIEHWLKSGGLIMLWTTLRNAAELLAPTDPETALTIWERAMNDPYAASLGGEAATHQNHRRQQAEQQLGLQYVDIVRERAKHIDRANVIELTIQALNRLKASHL